MESPHLGSTNGTRRRKIAFLGIRALRHRWTALLVAGLASIACSSNSSGPAGRSATGGATSTGGSPSSVAGGTTSTGGNPSGVVGGTTSTGGSHSGGASLADTMGGEAGAGPLDGYEVQVDPYGNCPLAAVVNIHGIEPDEVQGLQVVVAGQDGSPDFVREYSRRIRTSLFSWTPQT